MTIAELIEQLSALPQEAHSLEVRAGLSWPFTAPIEMVNFDVPGNRVILETRS